MPGRKGDTVTHRELELQLDAYVDGELVIGEALELEAHLKECGDCARLYQARVALSAAIRDQIPAFRAPEALRSRVQAAVHTAAGTPPVRHILPPAAARWLAVAASLAVVALGSWQLGSSRAGGHALADQVLASHLRSLMPGHLTDVISSDQHTVKPWFNGKLDFSPPVYDFSARGYPLVGGRLDYVGGRPVAALAYGRRQHLISVFLWPATQGPAGGPGVTLQQGYHLLHWTTPDYAYWVVSDLGMAELREFAHLIQEADSTVSGPAAVRDIR
jgi:anti-sigma factor RsiW